MNIGHWIKQLRDDLQLSQVALGEMLRVSGATVSRWENGSRAPRRSTLRLIEVETGRRYQQ